MDWFITFVLAGIVIFFFISKKKTGSTAQENPSATKPAVKQKDDFAGSSVGSFFLMEEFVDPGRRSLTEEQTFSEQGEYDEEEYDDFFEGEEF